MTNPRPKPSLGVVDGDWGDPDRSYLDDNQMPAPLLPVDVFGCWAPWLNQFAASACAPLDYAAAGLLAAASVTVGAARMVSPWPGWEEYAALWALMVGAPSASKSPVFAPIVAALKDLEREEGATFPEKHREFERDKRAALEANSIWERNVAQAVKTGRQAPIKSPAAEAPEEPQPPRLVVSDATVESLARLFKANPRGLVLARDELAGWVGNFGKYGGDGDAAFYIERFGGASVTVDRIKAGHMTAERGLLSVFGGIQPERLRESLLKRADDGLVARFQYFYPDPVARRRPAAPCDMEFLAAGLRRLRAIAFDKDDGRDVPRVLSLAPEASAAFEEWWRENGAAARDATGFTAGSLGKGPGIVLRIALLLELLEWAATEGQPELASVGEEAVVAACALFDAYLAPMAARVFGDANRSLADLAAVALLRHIRRGGARLVNVRDLQRAKMPGLRTAREVKAALAILAEAGWCRFTGGRHGDRPGVQRGDWSVNPLLWENPS